MNTGSPPPTGKRLSGFIVASKRPPTVEIDTEASAAYVRFGRGKVARTAPYAGPKNMVMVDFDARGRVLVIEVIGSKEFSIDRLLRKIPVKLPTATLLRTRYVSAELTAA